MVSLMRPADPATRQSNPAGAEATDSGEGHAEPATPASGGGWTFLSNHAHVLLCLAADPHQTLPMIAEQVGITTRAVQLILTDLIEGGYVERTKVGRRNQYRINPDGHLRHPLEAHHHISDLITALGPVTPDSGEIAVDTAADAGRAQRAG
jgi:predicted ArsR family transcriptional regulator